MKPANVKITPDGTVKVLDFGLAKALDSTPQAALSNSPTLLSAAVTGGGMILGTAGYMSPEQAKGQSADQRSDIFSFGCVLCEMLTGRQTFRADTVTETIAAVLMTEPDWQALPRNVHPKLHQLLRRALAKNRKDRWHAIGDVRVEIETILRDPDGVEARRVSERRPFWKMLVPAGIGVIAGAAAVTLAVSLLPGRDDASPLPSLQFEVEHPPAPGGNQFAVAPDGSRLVVVTGRADDTVLWLRSLGSGTDEVLRGTEGAADPFWSPDGRFIGFWVEGKLKKIDTIGGSPQTLGEAAQGRGAWNSDGTIIFGRDDGLLYRLPAAGGAAEAVTELDTSREEIAHLQPYFLPDGKRFLYLARSSKSENNAIVLGSLDSKKGKLLTPSNVAAVFSPPRHLLMMRDETLLAQEVDPSSFVLVGDPVPIVEEITSNSNNGRIGFAVSKNGILVFRHAGSGRNTLAWFDRSTSSFSTLDAAGVYRGPSLAPDSERMAGVRSAGAAADIWIYEPGRKTESRFTSDEATDQSPVWSRAGSRIVFRSNRDGNVHNLYVKDAGGGTCRG